MGDLSAHFSRFEFDCHDGTRANPDPKLIELLELARHLAGDRPLRIVSGYRSPAWNRKVQGAHKSQHLYNRAVDLEQGAIPMAVARLAGFTGIGSCNGFAVHVDVRPSPPVEFKDC